MSSKTIRPSLSGKNPWDFCKCGHVVAECKCASPIIHLDRNKKISKGGEPMEEHVDHPQHYGGEDNPYEAIKVIEAWGLGFCLGNTVKYISRAGKKDPAKELEDLKKAKWYLEREIQGRENAAR